ncbi:MAG: hypothetical protein AAB091_07490, partial [Elusimicrobiota bacterium]
NQILQTLRLINKKQNVLEQVLKYLMRRHKSYWKSSRPTDLKILSEKTLALKLDVSPGHLSRLASERALLTPWGETVALRRLFISPAQRRRTLIRQIQEDQGPSTARQIQKILNTRYRQKASIRLINLARHV